MTPTAVVTGMIATYPFGGVAWDYGQYALGLERLGFEVWYLEDTGIHSYSTDRGEYGSSFEYGARFTETFLTSMSSQLGERWHVRGGDGATYGLDPSVLPALVGDADLFLNVSNACLLREEYLANRRKVLIDTDPGWNHFMRFPSADLAPPPGSAATWRGHDRFFTYAELAGADACRLPALGVEWERTRPPVVTELWSAHGPGETWTTVLTWDNYGGTFEHDGQEYGSKAVEFEKVEQLPKHVDAKLELAVGGVEPPISRLRAAGWSVVDAPQISRTPQQYRDYLQTSRGELSVAKNAYVATCSGWFSCRSVCYLAAGRPAVLQDTGFSELVPTGEGLLAFSDLKEAAKAIETVEADYAAHAEAAGRVAREHFGAEMVLGELVERVGL